MSIKSGDVVFDGALGRRVIALRFMPPSGHRIGSRVPSGRWLVREEANADRIYEQDAAELVEYDSTD